MKIRLSRIPDSWRAKADAVGVILAIALVGPLMGLLLSAFGIVLAPPWTFLTSLIYLPIACLGLPIGIMAILRGWIRPWGLIAALTVAGIAALFYLAILGSWLPSGMTNCRALASSLPQVRYDCVSTSSDDTSYQYEFILEGWSGWPVMRLVGSKP